MGRMHGEHRNDYAARRSATEAAIEEIFARAIAEEKLAEVVRRHGPGVRFRMLPGDRYEDVVPRMIEILLAPPCDVGIACRCSWRPYPHYISADMRECHARAPWGPR